MNIIGRKNIFLTISAILIAASLICIGVFGFRQGIDFRGGTLWQFGIGDAEFNEAQMEEIFVQELSISDVRVNYEEDSHSVLARLPDINEATHQRGVLLLHERFPQFQELSFQSIGPSIGKELRTRAVWAIALVSVGISLYIAFAFRKVSRPVSSWKYGVITLITLVHDVAIPAGLLAILGRILGVEIDSNFVVALLVVMGFSVHDTIVVFDRIRENLSKDRGRSDFGVVINASINETFARSINTSLTLILVLISLLFVGPGALYYFVLTLLVGVTVGIYSSIFVASPALLLVISRRR